MAYPVQGDAAAQAMLDAFNSVLNATRTFASAVVAVLVWDTLSQLDREYRHVWRYKFSPITVAYAIARYWTIVSLGVTIYLMYWVGVRRFSQMHVRLNPLLQPHGPESCERMVTWVS